MVESINPTAKVDEQERKALSEGADIRDVYPDDYDEVISQSGLETSVDSQLKRTSKRRAFSFKYNCFYMQARNLSTDLTACSNIKRNLLTKYFSYIQQHIPFYQLVIQHVI